MVEEIKTTDIDSLSVDITHDELIHMLAGLQADIEARDIVIASLQCEQNILLVEDAKRYRYFIDKTFDIDLDDPILALQRDSHLIRTDSLDPNIPRDFHVGKVINVDDLIDNHRRTHAFYREQLHAADQRYAGLCASFEEERKRLERDAAQGDDVVAMLEKEREKLLAELENERNQNQCLQKELKKALDSYAHQKSLSQRQRIVAAQLIKEKHRLQKELSVKCAQIEQLESKLGLKSSSDLISDWPVSIALHRNSTSSAISPSGLRSSVILDVGGGESLSRKKSNSPPSGCCESANAPPLPPSPLVSTTTFSAKADPMTSPAVSSVTNHVNGCSPSSSIASVSEASSSNCDLPKAKSPPPAKTRPDPPIRRTPEFSSPLLLSTPSHKLNPLEVETNARTSVNLDKSPLSLGSEDDEKLIGSPSPPPPPPQMQLHYPYPGMQGNTHHPPVRGPSRSAAFGGGISHFGGQSLPPSASPIIPPNTSHFSPTRPNIRSPTGTPGTPHQFPYAKPQRVVPSSGGLRLSSDGGVSGVKKPSIPSLLSQQQQGRAIPITTIEVHNRPNTGPPGPRMAVAGRTAAVAGTGNMYINGK